MYTYHVVQKWRILHHMAISIGIWANNWDGSWNSMGFWKIFGQTHVEFTTDLIFQEESTWFYMILPREVQIFLETWPFGRPELKTLKILYQNEMVCVFFNFLRTQGIWIGRENLPETAGDHNFYLMPFNLKQMSFFPWMKNRGAVPQ